MVSLWETMATQHLKLIVRLQQQYTHTTLNLKQTISDRSLQPNNIRTN